MKLSVRKVKGKLKIKIKKCIELLGHEYKSLNYAIYFYSDKKELEKEKLCKPDMKVGEYDRILEGDIETAGVTLADQGKVKIFLFKFVDIEENPLETLNLIGNVYHEIRHAWQYENKLFQDDPKITNIEEQTDVYFQLPSEKDAYEFQEEQMNKCGKEILSIFGYSNCDFRCTLKEEIKSQMDI